VGYPDSRAAGPGQLIVIDVGESGRTEGPISIDEIARVEPAG